jgi:Lrp/AsnC family transcriptional regulator, regulator for asnA, asnC and gidA
MVKVDLKDRKILYHLDINSRRSFSQIGKKVGLNRDVVASRVKKLQEKGIIKKFSTYFDYLRLGFIPLRFYFKFQYVTHEIKKEIIDYFVNNKYSIVVFTLEGNYDLLVLLIVKNITDIYPFWKKTLQKYGDYFSRRVYSNYVGESIYRKSFLIDEKNERTAFILKRSGEKVDYDDLDFQILKLLSNNARIPTIEVAEKLNLTTKTINERIRKLIKSEIILGFKIGIDWNRLGYQYFKIDFFLREYGKINQIIKYIEMNPNLVYVDYTVGYADLELEFYLNNITQLHQIVEDLFIKFPKVIRNYTYFIVIKEHKNFIL